MKALDSDLSNISLPAKLKMFQIPHEPQKQKRSIRYHIHSLWLFTFSDLKTIVVPKTIFGIVTVLSGQKLTTDIEPEFATVLACTPLIIAWIWLNLLPLDISNQYNEKSILEDKENKPWRPIPAGRLAINETRWLMVSSYIAAFLASSYLGGMAECILLMVEGSIYNELDGANNSLLARNFLNAAGYMTFASGAARVACKASGTQLRGSSSLWLILLSTVIMTTIQFQDLYDQKGDALRGRRTIPLLAGDSAARLTVVVPIAVWSWLCPAFWELEPQGFILSNTLGVIIIFRLFCYRCVKEDKRSFLIWNLWVMSLYALPLVKNVMEPVS
ncbi:hypothetical protein MMC20_005450 [Loxospora ochrophaea]|nr:hypothetical protein [Loxospora ochrophaea]